MVAGFVIGAGSQEASCRLPLRLLLKRETAELHRRVERAVGAPTTLTSLDRYLAMLKLWLGFYAPLEAALETFTRWSELGLCLEERRKTPLLEADLTRLGARSSTVSACWRLPALSSFERALGAMYVLEGATLGGQIIVRGARRTLGPIPATFLDGYGAATGRMWREFTDALARYDEVGGDASEVAVGAALAFRSLEQWTVDARWTR